MREIANRKFAIRLWDSIDLTNRLLVGLDLPNQSTIMHEIANRIFAVRLGCSTNLSVDCHSKPIDCCVRVHTHNVFGYTGALDWLD